MNDIIMGVLTGMIIMIVIGIPIMGAITANEREIERKNWCTHTHEKYVDVTRCMFKPDWSRNEQ